MLRNLHGLFWLVVVLVGWFLVGLAHVASVVFDEFVGWIDRAFDDCFGDW